MQSFNLMNVQIQKRPNQRCHPLSFVSEGVKTDGSENPHGPATVSNSDCLEQFFIDSWRFSKEYVTLLGILGCEGSLSLAFLIASLGGPICRFPLSHSGQAAKGGHTLVVFRNFSENTASIGWPDEIQKKNWSQYKMEHVITGSFDIVALLSFVNQPRIGQQ